MTPDTTAYMIAGFAVIIAGVLAYGISLVTRFAAAKHQVKLLAEHDPSKHSTEHTLLIKGTNSVNPPKTNRSKLTRFAWLSIAVALLTIGLKATAYFLTGSVGLLSDALESIVNLVGATMALIMLTIAARPADEEHTFGHSKAEYFSSGTEGALIVVAAISIIYTAVNRLLHPQPLEQLGIGLLVSVGASLANLVVSIILRRAGARYNSITLTADAKHLMTDVLTSGGVLIGVGIVALTGWQILDPIVAILVALNIIWTGVNIARHSIAGLMDSALGPQDLAILQKILKENQLPGIEFHDIRTRQSAAVKFITMHVLVPGDWTVTVGHQFTAKIEAELMAALPESVILTHLEPLGLPISYEKSIIDDIEME